MSATQAIDHSAILHETAAPNLRPIEESERVALLDILRGFAIFGILVVNLLYFSGPIQWVIDPPWTGVNALVRHFIELAFAGKFYSLFSMLFGIGLALQMDRAVARGVDMSRLYKRRLLVLLLIGIAHAVLIWYGDILHLYALLGFILLAFRRRSTFTLRVTIVLLLLVPALLMLFFAGLMALAGFDAVARSDMSAAIAEQAREFDRDAGDAIQAYSRGTYVEVLQRRVKDLLEMDSYSFLFAPHVMAMFLLGLYVGRERIFLRVSEDVDSFRRFRFQALIVGCVFTLLYVVMNASADPLVPSLVKAVATLLYVFGAPALMLFYATTIALAVQTEPGRRLLSPLAAVGRTALSNYLLQSLICTTVFYSHGFGLFGRATPVHCIALAVAIFSLQIPLSIWWMRRFRFGPAEWLWRSLTYGKAQPMRHLSWNA